MPEVPRRVQLGARKILITPVEEGDCWHFPQKASEHEYVEIK